jgi:hypothetical protein
LGWTSLVALIALAGCPGDDDDSTPGDDDATPGDDDDITTDDDDSAPEPPLEFQYTFAILADPHVTSSGENLDRLGVAVDWINSVADERQVELVLVLGDVAWNSGLDIIVEALDELDMPYAAMIGDNEVASDDEEAFDTTFAPTYEALSADFDNWSRTVVPVHNPLADQDNWFSNFSFDHRGVHFVAVDWCARGAFGALSEVGDLHDFDGGSFQWFTADLAAMDATAADSVVMASHIPMHLGLLDLDELAQVEALLLQYEEQVYGQFAGHIHADAEVEESDGLWTVYVTDATWDDEVRVRLVEVSGNGLRFEYEHELVDVPY